MSADAPIQSALIALRKNGIAQKKYVTASCGTEPELLCAACYIDDSLHDLGVVVLGPYTGIAPDDEQKTPFLPSFAVEHAVDLLHRFVREYSHKKAMYEEFDKSASYHFAVIAQYIEENVCENLTLATVAEKVNLSKPYVCAIVKEATGFTASRLIAMAKVNKAKILFWNGLTDMGEVAGILGYKSQSYFSRQFKDIEGVSPMGYIKGYLQGKD